MARYQDYIRFLNEDDGAPEGDGEIILSLVVEGSGSDGNYGNVTLPLFEVEVAGESNSQGNIEFPALGVEAYSGTHGKITLPIFEIEGLSEATGYGNIYFPMFRVIGDGDLAPTYGGDITLPALELDARGGPLIKIYQLCNNENWGL